MITHRFRSFLGAIPDTWDVTALGCVVKRSSSGDWGDDSGEIPLRVLRSTNFTNGRRLDFGDVATRWFSVDRADRFDIRGSDILVERSGGGPSQPVGRVVVTDRDLPGYAFSNFVQLLRIDEAQIDPDFVAWCLVRLHQSGLVERLQHQTTQMRNLDLRDYLRIRLPRPPREEQEQVAAALSAGDHADVALERLRIRIDRLRKALLEQLFTRGLPGKQHKLIDGPMGPTPEGWKVVRLKRLIARIEAGSSPQCEAHPARTGHWGVLKVSAVSWDAFDERENKELPPAIDPDLAAEVHVGDLIVSRANTTGLCGAAQVVRRLDSKLLLCDKTWRLVPAEGIDAEWLVRLLKTQVVRRQIEARATGTSDSMKNISQRDFARMWVTLPPEDERHEIAEILQGLDLYRDSVVEQGRRLTEVNRSLLQNLVVGRVRLVDPVLT